MHADSCTGMYLRRGCTAAEGAKEGLICGKGVQGCVCVHAGITCFAISIRGSAHPRPTLRHGWLKCHRDAL
eukprot:1158026-Pelagomonas_calceolata.AAC.5